MKQIMLNTLFYSCIISSTLYGMMEKHFLMVNSSSMHLCVELITQACKKESWEGRLQEIDKLFAKYEGEIAPLLEDWYCLQYLFEKMNRLAADADKIASDIIWKAALLNQLHLYRHVEAKYKQLYEKEKNCYQSNLKKTIKAIEAFDVPDYRRIVSLMDIRRATCPQSPIYLTFDRLGAYCSLDNKTKMAALWNIMMHVLEQGPSSYKDRLTNCLKKDGVNLEMCDEDQNTFLHWAMQKNYLQMVRYLLDDHTVYVDPVNAEGSTPLLELFGPPKHTYVVGHFLGKRAVMKCDSISTEKNNSEWSYFLQQLNHPNIRVIVDVLLNAGAHLNVQDKEGNTPLHRGLFNERVKEVGDVLLKHKTNIDSTLKNNAEKTVYELAYEMHQNIIKENNMSTSQFDLARIIKLLEAKTK